MWSFPVEPIRMPYRVLLLWLVISSSITIASSSAFVNTFALVIILFQYQQLLSRPPQWPLALWRPLWTHLVLPSLLPARLPFPMALHLQLFLKLHFRRFFCFHQSRLPESGHDSITCLHIPFSNASSIASVSQCRSSSRFFISGFCSSWRFFHSFKRFRCRYSPRPSASVPPDVCHLIIHN